MTDPLAPREVSTPLWWPLLRTLLLLLCVWLVAFPLVLFLRPALSYRVADGQITASSVASRTVIPAGTPVKEEPLVTRRRQFGSAIPGYVVGVFDVAGHPGARLYTDGSSPGLVQAIATTGRPETALLLKQEGRTYYLTPNDPQAAAGKFRATSDAGRR